MTLITETTAPEYFDTLSDLRAYLDSFTQKYSQTILVTDALINKLYLWDCSTLIIPEGESAKSIETATFLWERFSKIGLDRRSLVVTCGGGSICDTVGFAASCYMRGIDTLYIPTTLLAMVDAAIGGKTGINFGLHKNLVGTFHPPRKVLITAEFLKSLPPREFASGMAEVIKTAVVWSPSLFEELEAGEFALQFIEQCAKIKSEIVARDQYDNGIRAYLNWGHTVGHALEEMTGYKRWLHGEAVAIGMSCEAFLSWHLGYADKEFYIRQNRLIQKYHLPIELPHDIDIETLIQLMTKDKKAVKGKIGLILARQIGTVLSVHDLDKDILKQALEAKRSADPWPK